LKRLLNWLIGLVHAAPILVLVLSGLLFLISLGLAKTSLSFEAERSAMLDPRERYRALEEAYKLEFPNDDDLVVVVDGGSAPARERLVDDLIAKLADDPLYLDVFGRTDLDFFRRRAIGYLPPEVARQLLRKDDANKIGLIANLLSQVCLGLEQDRPVTFQLPGLKANSPELKLLLGQQRYLYNALPNTQIHIVLVRPSQQTKQAIDQLQTQLSGLRKAYPALRIGLTGRSVIQADEISCAKRDARWSTLVSALLVLALFRMSFPSFKLPIIGLASVILSIGWTLGFVTLAIGHLNMLTLTFAAMLVGLGADFSIHILLGFREQRGQGDQPLAAMQHTMTTAGLENWVGALTSALAFAAICYTEFLGIRELGLIAAVGIMLCFLGSVTTLPALLFLCDQPSSDNVQPSWSHQLEKAERLLQHRPRSMLAICVLACLGGALWSGRVQFDYNLLHLQDDRLESVRTELELVSAGRGVLSAKCLAANEQEARTLITKLKKLPTVERVESVLRLVPEVKANNDQLLERLRSRSQEFNQGAALTPALLNGWITEGRLSTEPQVRQQAQKAAAQVERLKLLAIQRGPGPVVDATNDLAQQVKKEVSRFKALLDSQIAESVNLTNLPASLRLRGVGKSGTLALRIYPKYDIWDHAEMARFVKEVQSVAPSACELPISVYYHTDSLKIAYERSAWTALAAITMTLILYFRSISKTLLALLPKLTGVLWMLGLMGLVGVDFNPVNLIVLPMILGTGLVFGVHVVHRLLHDLDRPLFQGAAGPAIALSGLSTVAGFVTLIPASHQGMSSLGFVMTAGVLANLLTSLLILPAFMRLTRGTTESAGQTASAEQLPHTPAAP
jgi:hopanoid biosynthesis associated RND transporter like protein HpnN